MKQLLDILAVILLLLIAFEDFSYRAVSWLLFPGLAITLLACAYLRNPLGIVLLQAGINAGFVTFQGILLKFYYLLKIGKKTSLINSKIGIGDILFLYAITFYFSPFNFVLFYILTLLVTIIVVMLLRLINSTSNLQKNIPLAGILAIFLLIPVVATLYPGFNAGDDQWLLTFLSLK